MENKDKAIIHVVRISLLLFLNLLILSGIRIFVIAIGTTPAFHNAYTTMLIIRFFADENISFVLSRIEFGSFAGFFLIPSMAFIVSKRIHRKYADSKSGIEDFEKIILLMYTQIRNMLIIYLSVFIACIIFASTYDLDPLLPNHTADYFNKLLDVNNTGSKSGGGGSGMNKPQLP